MLRFENPQNAKGEPVWIWIVKLFFDFFFLGWLKSMARVKHTPASRKIGICEIQLFSFVFSLQKPKPWFSWLFKFEGKKKAARASTSTTPSQQSVTLWLYLSLCVSSCEIPNLTFVCWNCDWSLRLDGGEGSNKRSRRVCEKPNSSFVLIHFGFLMFHCHLLKISRRRRRSYAEYSGKEEKAQ